MLKESHVLTKNNINIRKAYFDEVFLPSFEKIKNKKDKITQTYLVANKKIQINFYSTTIQERLGRALIHNLIENSTSGIDLYINVLDALFTGVDIVAPWSKTEYFEQEINSQKHIDESFLGAYLHWENTINIYDQINKTAYFWTHDINQLPEWISAAPLRTILHWFLSTQKIHLIHGAVIGINGNSVLLSAKGGSGKSTTALSCLLSGMDYLADDYVAIKYNQAYSLYNSVKITPDSLQNFPELKDKIWNKNNVGGMVDKGKAIIFLSEIFPKQIKQDSRLTAIFIPLIKKENTETKITKATNLQAMLALTPTTLFQLPLASSNKITELKEIITETPCYFIELGPNIREVPNTIKDFLKNQSGI